MDIWREFEVTLEVDHEILTVEHVTMINQFWYDYDSRLSAENDDVVKAVTPTAICAQYEEKHHG